MCARISAYKSEEAQHIAPSQHITTARVHSAPHSLKMFYAYVASARHVGCRVIILCMHIGLGLGGRKTNVVRIVCELRRRAV